MIEIIKHGDKDKYWSVTTKCPKCGCIFRFNPYGDTYHTDFYDEDRIDCPDCDYEIVVFDGESEPDSIICNVIEEEYLK